MNGTVQTLFAQSAKFSPRVHGSTPVKKKPAEAGKRKISA